MQPSITLTEEPTGEKVWETPTYSFKTPYNHNTEQEALRTALFCMDESKAQQHGKEEADINTIVDRFTRTGLMPQIPLPPSYEDFDEVFDFQSAMNLIAAANASFMKLPAEIRDAFRNDPQTFAGTIDSMLTEKDQAKREENLRVLRAMNLAVAPGPIADKTTLGDVLKAIKEQGTPKEPTPKTP